MRLCVVCDGADALLCKRCKSAPYCSPACQKADWPVHKLLCTAFTKFDIESRPTNEHIRAVLFPEPADKPKLIWLRWKWCYPDEDDSGSRFQLAETEGFVGENSKSYPVCHNVVLDRPLSNTVQICVRDTFLIDGSKPNRSVAAVTATKPGQYHDWRGPIVAYSNLGSGIDPGQCKDVDMIDFRHIADYFLSYGYEPPASPPQAVQEPLGRYQNIKGVRINCLGDREILKKPPFEAVDVPPYHTVFNSMLHDTSGIADRIGLPIYTHQCAPDSKWAHRGQRDDIFINGASPYNNQDATYLHQCCDPKSTKFLGWGWASQRWQHDVGSVIVVRQDKKPLLPEHVEALCRYCNDEVRPLMAHSMGEYLGEKSSSQPLEKEFVVKMICRPLFEIHWYKFVQGKRDAEGLLNIPFPYDM